MLIDFPRICSFSSWVYMLTDRERQTERETEREGGREGGKMWGRVREKRREAIPRREGNSTFNLPNPEIMT